MKNRIFFKIFGASVLAIAVTVAGLDVYLSRYTEQRYIGEVVAQLSAEGRILAGELASVPKPDVEAWAKTTAQRAQARVTLIDRSGLVLGDSEHAPETMENHAARPEIRTAIEGKTGSAIRHSATLDRDLCYVAVPTQYEGNAAALRLSVPVQELNAAVTPVRQRVLVASGVAAFAALLIAYLFSRALTKRINRLRRMAEALPADASIDLEFRASDDELGMLERTFRTMSAHLHDLVERLKLESARREAILVSMSEGLLAVDERMRVVFHNEAFARAVGARPEGSGATPVTQLIRSPEINNMLTQTIQTGSRDTQRVRLRSGWFEAQAAPLKDGGKNAAILILHDITDIERLERVRKDFVANVSHELRTPLAAIRGYAETLLNGALEDADNNRRFVEIIQAQATRLNNIASDLLTLSDLESGKAVPPQTVSVAAALDAAVSTVEPEAKVRGVKLSVGRTDDCQISGHRMRLEQALINLIDNAVKFNRPGGEVRIDVVRGSEDETRITVADTGVGIPSEDLPRVFERFYRVDKARSRAVGGTGLGLSIVKHVVESAGGSIDVQSQLGKGSRFELTFPAVR